jgi:hypothetical protein
MIAYILLSYVAMFLFFFMQVSKGRDTVKSAFKWWLFSPVVIVLLIVVRFTQW